MSLFKRLLNRPLSADEFAKWMIKRLRASGETHSINYDRAQFRLDKPGSDNHFFLSNLYQEYRRLPKADHENLVRSFLTTWHTSGMKAPQEFNDAKADLLPALRARGYLEIDTAQVSENLRVQHDIPHIVIADHLVVTLVYDLPKSMMTVSAELLEQWGVTLYEALEVAKDNLRENTRQFAKIGNLIALTTGDSYDASRLILTDFIRHLEVKGEPIAAVPNREAMYVCGSEDEDSLRLLAELVKKDIHHERYISGMLFRLVDNDWEVWLPPEGHPLFDAFRELYVQSLGQEYGDQKNLLDQRHELEKTDIFVASFSAMRNKTTGRIRTYCVWSEGVDSLLPETDEIFFYRPNKPENEKRAAADWDAVRRLAGSLFEEVDVYPTRWRVRSFPTDEVLKKVCRPIG
jgi:hypothetical protein